MTPSTFHVLLTRFNVRRTTALDPRVVSRGWLETRIRLSRQITVPSVLSQTHLPNSWLVFFDECTPDVVRAEFQQLAASLPMLKPEYCRVLTSELCAERIGWIMHTKANWLLSTRLDSDDALNRRFIETVAALARPGVREFINPTFGLIVADGRLYRRCDHLSPFITLSEPAEHCQTVWIDQHQRLARHGRVRQFSLPDAWIQVVHGGNLANEVRGVRTSPKRVSAGALPPALSDSVVTLGLGELMVDNSLGLLRRCASRAWRRYRRTWAESPLVG